MEEAVIQYWVAYNHCVISLSARGGRREKKPSVKQCLGEIRSLRLDLAGWKRQGVLQRARKKWLNGRRQGGNRGFVPCTQPLWYVLIVEIRVLRVCLNSGNRGAQGDAPMWRRVEGRPLPSLTASLTVKLAGEGPMGASHETGLAMTGGCGRSVLACVIKKKKTDTSS